MYQTLHILAYKTQPMCRAPFWAREKWGWALLPYPTLGPFLPTPFFCRDQFED